MSKRQIPQADAVRMPLDMLLPADYNPRRISDRAMKGLRASLERFGELGGIVYNKRTGRLVGGHQRVKALAAMGIEDAEVRVVDLPVAEEKAANLALNHPGIGGEWDEALLAVVLAEVERDLPTAYEELQLDDLIGEAASDELAEGLTDPDDVPEPMPDPVTRAGDVWVLGAHRIICGDCRNAEDVATLLAGDRINVGFTSPPYASQRKYDEASGFKPIPPDEYVEWFCDVQKNVRASLAEDGSWFVNIKEHCEDGQRHLYVKDLTIAHVRAWAWAFIDELCWERGGVPGRWDNRFKNAWEPVFHFAAGSQVKLRHENVAHASEDVISYDKRNPKTHSGFLSTAAGGRRSGLALPSNVIRVHSNPNQTDTGAVKHTATFPVGLPLFFIKAYSDGGDVVFDPFMGSGTTLIACEQAGRKARGTEISPAYCDLIVNRWQTFTGKMATLDGDGRTFDEVKEERHGATE